MACVYVASCRNLDWACYHRNSILANALHTAWILKSHSSTSSPGMCTDRKQCVASSLNFDGFFFLNCALQTFLLPALSRKCAHIGCFSTVTVAPNVCTRQLLRADQLELKAKRRDSQASSDFALNTDKTAL